MDTAATPNRFVTSIHIDPANPDRAWISYSGYGSNTPTTPGHAFEVTATADGATWSDRSYDFGDQPITDLVRDGACLVGGERVCASAPGQRILIHTDEYEVLATVEFLGERVGLRNLFDAGPAPRRPEIENHDIAAQRCQKRSRLRSIAKLVVSATRTCSRMPSASIRCCRRRSKRPC